MSRLSSFDLKVKPFSANDSGETPGRAAGIDQPRPCLTI
jgi:hypothetical protein